MSKTSLEPKTPTQMDWWGKYKPKSSPAGNTTSVWHWWQHGNFWNCELGIFLSFFQVLAAWPLPEQRKKSDASRGFIAHWDLISPERCATAMHKASKHHSPLAAADQDCFSYSASNLGLALEQIVLSRWGRCLVFCFAVWHALAPRIYSRSGFNLSCLDYYNTAEPEDLQLLRAWRCPGFSHTAAFLLMERFQLHTSTQGSFFAKQIFNFWQGLSLAVKVKILQ